MSRAAEFVRNRASTRAEVTEKFWFRVLCVLSGICGGAGFSASSLSRVSLCQLWKPSPSRSMGVRSPSTRAEPFCRRPSTTASRCRTTAITPGLGSMAPAGSASQDRKDRSCRPHARRFVRREVVYTTKHECAGPRLVSSFADQNPSTARCATGRRVSRQDFCKHRYAARVV